MKATPVTSPVDALIVAGVVATGGGLCLGCGLYVSLLGTLFLQHGAAGVNGAPDLVHGAAILMRGLMEDGYHPWLLLPGRLQDVNPSIFWTVAAVVLTSGLSLGVYLHSYVAGVWRGFGGDSTRSHGESRWARGLDLRHLGRRAWPSRLKPDGIVVGWLGMRVLQAPAEDNVIVFGVQRSGKTSTVVVPTLLGWRGAVVATSTKEELVRLTGRHRARLGPVWVFAPIDNDIDWITELDLQAARWNPLSEIRDAARALEIADLFTSEGKQGPSAHWYLSAANLIAGLVLAARDEGEDLRAVVAWLNNLSLSHYVSLANRQRDLVAKELLTAFANTPSKEAGSVASTARSCLSLWLDNRVARATAAKGGYGVDLDVKSLLETGGALYLVAPAEEAERCRPLFSALLQSLLAAATLRARRQGGTLAPRLLLALDEVANFARIPRLGGYTSTGPGQGIQVLLCFHDLAQLEGAYGPEQSRTIWNNCRARLLLPGQGDLRTLEHFSKAIGDETRGYELSSFSSEGRWSQSEQRIGRPLATPDSLRRMKEPVLLYASAPPAKLRARRWDQVAVWRALVDPDNRPRRQLWKGAGWLPPKFTKRSQELSR